MSKKSYINWPLLSKPHLLPFVNNSSLVLFGNIVTRFPVNFHGERLIPIPVVVIAKFNTGQSFLDVITVPQCGEFVLRNMNLLPDVLVQFDASLIAQSRKFAAPIAVETGVFTIEKIQQHESYNADVLDFRVGFKKGVFGENIIASENHKA